MATAKKKQTASDFVRTFAPEVTTDEIIAAGKAAGYRLSRAHVYTIRSTTKRRAAVVTAPKQSPEEIFARAALDVGLTRAREILDLLAQSIQGAVMAVATAGRRGPGRPPGPSRR